MGFLASVVVGRMRASTFRAVATEIGGVFVTKTADETITSSTTLQNDDELFVPMVATATYILTGMIIYRAAATPLIRATWTVPAGATMIWTPGALDSSITTTFHGDVNKAYYDLSVVPGWGAAGIGTSVVATPSGLITNVTAGNLTFQWAQSVSNATGTIVKAGSWIQLVRVA